jgi:hypothetical protein
MYSPVQYWCCRFCPRFDAFPELLSITFVTAGLDPKSIGYHPLKSTRTLLREGLHRHELSVHIHQEQSSHSALRRASRVTPLALWLLREVQYDACSVGTGSLVNPKSCSHLSSSSKLPESQVRANHQPSPDRFTRNRRPSLDEETNSEICLSAQQSLSSKPIDENESSRSDVGKIDLHDV